MSEVATASMTHEEYLAHRGISQSDLKLFALCPPKFYKQKVAKTLPQSPDSESFRFGRLIEAFIRGDGLQGITIIPPEVLAGNGAKSGNKYKKEWLPAQLAAGVPPESIMTQKEYDKDHYALKAIKENINRHDLAREFLMSENGEWHKTNTWSCPTSSILRKAELDRSFDGGEGKRMVIDLKSTIDPTPYRFAGQVKKLGYDKQGATYLESQGWGIEESNFFIVAIRNKKPYDVHTHRIPTAWLSKARDWSDEKMIELKGVWTAYSETKDPSLWDYKGQDKINDLVEPGFSFEPGAKEDDFFRRR